MNVTWIPGDADLVVLGAALMVLALSVWAGVRVRSSGRDRSDAPRVRESAAMPAASAQGSAGTTATSKANALPAGEMPEAAGERFARRRSRLGGRLGERLAGFFSQSNPDDAAWRELEEALLLADVGASTAADLIAQVRRSIGAGETTPKDALREALIAAIGADADRSLALAKPGSGTLAPVLVVGVNGVGKTTTVGKLARLLVAEGYHVVLGAADTFRAAAADQLETWGARVGVATVRSDRDGADPASVAHDATASAEEGGADVVLIDTAGRLQNKAGLMDQLGKIERVVTKVARPREILLVLDATTGQNGLAQAAVFGEVVPLTGIVLTKMDGTAKGGIVLAVQRNLGVPVKFVGLGEGADDLAPFDVEGFVDGLLGESE